MYLILELLFFVFEILNFYFLFSGQSLIWNSVFAFILLLILPGALVLLALDFRKFTFWEGISLIVGISTAVLMLMGLIINFSLPYFNINPLSKEAILNSLNILLLFLFGLNFYKYRSSPHKYKFGTMLLNWRASLKRVKNLDILAIITAMVFPALAVVGAINLNNGGENIFTMVMLGGIALYVLFIALFRNKFIETVFPSAIFFTSLALLLMTSMRGWYITGHDIQFEYYIFQLTKVSEYWDISFYRDAYNACLSITILPTMLSKFFGGNDVYIFKIVYQIIFSFCPVIIYYFLKKYTSPFLSFVSTFYFLTFPTFLNDMPMLNRQEIAFLFFAMILYMAFVKSNAKGRSIILMLSSFGLVTSHYSTNYVTIAVIALTLFSLRFIQLYWVKKIATKNKIAKLFLKKTNKFRLKQFIPTSVLVVTLLLTFFWNGLVTRTSNDLIRTATGAITNIGSILKQENKSVDIAYSLFSTKKLSDEEYLKEYVEKSINKAKEEDVQDFYDEVLSTNYEPQKIENVILPATIIGKFLKDYGIDVYSFNFNSRQLLAKLIQLLILIGTITIFFIKKSKYDSEYVIMCLVSLLLIFLMVVLPGVSVSYGLLRLFQQFLMLLGLPAVLGIVFILGKFKKSRIPLFTTAILVFFFLNLSGFVSEITGGYYPQFNLRNEGIYYDGYYVYASERAAIKWLSGAMPANSTVQSDKLSRDKLWAYGNIPSIDGSLPQTFRKSSYIYSTYLNVKGKTVVSVDRSIVVEYPLDFLNQNKNLIYNNGESRIYR